jgi:hypothetical protein
MVRWSQHGIVLAGILLIAVTAFLLSPPGVRHGRVLDEVSGRVASGVEITSDKLKLQRFSHQEFSIPAHLAKSGKLTFSAPGYVPQTLDLEEVSWPIDVRLKPVDIPQLGGIAAFPKLIGEQLTFDLQLLNGNGQVLGEYPGVGLVANVIIADVDGNESGRVAMPLVRNDTGQSIALSGEVSLSTLREVAVRNPATFSVLLVAGSRTAQSRDFSAPPGLKSAAEQVQ